MVIITAKPPFKYFTELDGTALVGGKIYIGVAGLDPQANPIPIYWDAAATILAPQPVRTIAGVPENGGSPSDFFALSDYSITVRDVNDVLVYSKLQLNANELAAATSLNFWYQIRDVDAATRSAALNDGSIVSIEGILYEVDSSLALIDSATQDLGVAGLKPFGAVTPQHYGAVGDGATDDSVAVGRALSVGSGVVDGMSKTFAVNSAITPTPPAINETLSIKNMTLDFSSMPDQAGSPDFAITFSGMQGAAVSLTGNLTANTEVATVGAGNTGTFAVDQDVWLQSDAIFETGGGVILGHLAKVQAIDAISGTITLHTDALYDFTTADNATISPLTMAGQIIVGDGLRVVGARMNAQNGIRFRRCKDPVIAPGVSVADCDYAGFTFDRCVGGSVFHPAIERSELVGFSYGLTISNGCRGLVIHGGHGEDMRHFVTGGDNEGVNVFITVANCYLSGMTDAGLDAHGAGDYWTFKNNTIVGSHTTSGAHDGIILQGNNVTITDNTIKSFRRNSIFHQPLPVIGEVSAVITGNVIHSSGGGSGGEAAINITANNRRVRSVVISNNLWQGVSSSEYFIFVQAVQDIERLSIIGNVMSSDCTATISAVRIRTTSTAEINSCAIMGNTFTADVGQIVYLEGSGGEISNVALTGNVLSSSVAGVEAVRLVNIHGFTETGNQYNLNASSRVYNISETTCADLILDERHTPERISTAPTLTIDPDENYMLINEGGTTTVTLPAPAVYPGRLLRFHQTDGTGPVISASSNVIPIDQPATTNTAILPATDGSWCEMRSNGTNWRIIAQGS